MNAFQRLSLGAIAVLLLISPSLAQVRIDALLTEQLSTQHGPFEVIVTFRSNADVSTLGTLGVPFTRLTELPMAGLVLTREQLELIRSWQNVESVYLNAPIAYSNNGSGTLTGAHYVQSALGFKGRGVTVLVLDSGIDGSHPDVSYGSKVVQNVKIVSDQGYLGVTAVVEGVVNTDNSSGHGSHVAGTVGGTGAASAQDERDPYYYRGVAPEATLVGVGAGEALFILAALQGFDYALANQDRYGIDVITNSWGNTSSQFDPYNPISVASYEAYRRGIVVTFAAGNEGPSDNSMSTYAVNPWVIGVAAGDGSKALADFSSRGESSESFEHPDITAPGVDITSVRAVGTPVGALGPVVDPAHPSYAISYNILSGTSMATPFIAGTVALMLEANPSLSPDQIEDILKATSDPMPGYAYHQSGNGYVNVRRAVELSVTTTGSRQQFLDGDTKWASQGDWTLAEEADPKLGYYGQWISTVDESASGGSYVVGKARRRGSAVDRRPFLRAVFYGEAVKLSYPTTRQGGGAKLLVDGVERRDVSFYSDEPRYGVVTSVSGLTRGPHVLELRSLHGETYLDALLIDGSLFQSTASFVVTESEYTGTLGPSVDGAAEIHRIPFDVSSNVVQINAELSWTGGVDVDLYLTDPSGNRVASGATLANPEVLSYWVSGPGTYTYEVVGYATVTASYTLTNSLTVVEEGAQSSSSRALKDEQRRPASTESRTELALENYPNPFNPVTRLRYSLPQQSHVRLKVYNLLGAEVATLVDGTMSAGRHTVPFDATRLPSGLYFGRLETDRAVVLKKLLYLK